MSLASGSPAKVDSQGRIATGTQRLRIDKPPGSKVIRCSLSGVGSVSGITSTGGVLAPGLSTARPLPGS